jgi:hypothetical protein
LKQAVEVQCPCGARFRARASLKGGLANCTACGKAAPVPGGVEPLFWLLVASGVLLVCAVTAAFWIAGSPVAGGIAFGIGAAVLAAIILAS